LTQVPVRVDGLLTVQFHGDRAAGCAARGLCGYSGTVVWQPARSGSVEILTYRQHEKLEHQASLGLNNFNAPGPIAAAGGVATADVRSQPGGPSGPSSGCTDAAATGGNVSLPVRGHAVLFSLQRASPGLTETRCAAPLVSDLASALVSRSLNLQTLSRGQGRVALASSGGFAAGGFAGTVSSTVRLSFGRATTQPGISGAPGGPKVRFRSVEVRYRATLAGRVLANLRGDPRSCSLLGSCGAVGSFELRSSAMSGELFVTAFTRAQRPLRDLLTALGLRTGGNPRGIATFGSVSLSGPGSFAAGFSQGAATCQDSVAAAPAAISLQIGGGTVGATYAPSRDSLHTRCPGPLIDGSAALATGSAPLRALGRRTATIPLSAGVNLLDDGYVGRTVSNLRLTITRTLIRTTVQSVPGG
jgi:hypothetical protein